MDQSVKNINDLDNLFKEWKEFQYNDGLYETLQKYHIDIKNNAFAIDGEIVKNEFNKMGFRVLYIMSESNAHGKVEGQDQSKWDLSNEFRRFANKGEDWKSRLKTKICEMQKIILKTEIGIDIGIRETANTIAVINLNKRGGGKSISNKYFLEYFEPYVKKHSDFIKREVEILNPDLIICCGNVPFDLMNKHGLSDEFKDRVIHMWHPSYNQIPKGNVESENCISKSIVVRRYIGEFEKRYLEHRTKRANQC